MSGVSVPSPAILKRSTGAANVGTAGGDTVQQWVTAFDVAMGEVQSDVGALESLAGTFVPKTGGTFSGDIKFVKGCYFRGYDLSGKLQAMLGIGSVSGRVIIGHYENTVDTYHSVSEANSIAMFIGNASDDSNRRFTLSAAGVRFGSSGAICKTILDEDDFASNSATALATQQSIKSYVDTSVAAIPLPSRELISSANITSGVAAVDLVLGGYDGYVIELLNVIPEQSSRFLRMRTSSDGGVTFDDGLSDYYVRVLPSGSVGNTDSIVLGTNVSVSSLAVGGGLSASLKVAGMEVDGYKQIFGSGGYFGDNNVGEAFSLVGMRKTAEPIDAIRLYFNSGDIASGKIALYGVNL